MPSARGYTWLALAGLATLAATTPLPDYILTYAPYSYLDFDEYFWPSEIITHLQHVIPQINHTSIANNVALSDLQFLDGHVFLTSKDDSWTKTDAPATDWMLSAYGKPAEDGSSAAPATIIAVNKPGGIVDAFYFYFYSFDFSTITEDGKRYGNHVGDWEHSMVRFENGNPTHVYLSAHAGGSAYTYDALPKSSLRPITYIARGSHANYATAGPQQYQDSVPGDRYDHTSKGPVWDVTKNFRGFWYDPSANAFNVASGIGAGGATEESEGASWLTSWCQWGDDITPKSLDNDQYCYNNGTACHYAAGPTGPISKNLGREKVCQNESNCAIKTSMDRVGLNDIV